MNEKLRHLDLFSGIGGFALGLESTGGFETVGFCDNEPFAQKVLKKHWPDVPCYEDVRDVGVDTVGYRGVDIITGGFPCQPYSVAGKQDPKDNRQLWPEMFRIIKEIRPTYVIGENVRNLISIREGVVFEQVCTDLEGEGYEVQTFVLPASAVNAPHQRYRCWIVGILADTESERQQPLKNRTKIIQSSERQKILCRSSDAIRTRSNKDRWTDKQRMGGTIDGLSKGLDRHWGDGWEEGTPRVIQDQQKNRKKRLKALGNSVIPQIPALLGRAILEVHNG